MRRAAGLPGAAVLLMTGLLSVLLLTGCDTRFYSAKGAVGSSGPAFGDWASTPAGCSRAPIDGLPIGQSRTIATFVWQDPADYDVMRRDQHAATAPDVPLEFDLLREGAGRVVRLRTVKTDGTLVHPGDCTQFNIETREMGPSFAGGKSALAGRVRLECQVKGSRVWADLRFRRCEF